MKIWWNMIVDQRDGSRAQYHYTRISHALLSPIRQKCSVFCQMLACSVKKNITVLRDILDAQFVS